MPAGDVHIVGAGGRPLCGGRGPLRGFHATSSRCRACDAIRRAPSPSQPPTALPHYSPPAVPAPPPPVGFLRPRIDVFGSPLPPPVEAPLVSIVTCSHERPELLRRAVESLREQTRPDFEHLICDDASRDSRVLETLAWAQEDPRVRVWRTSENLNRPGVLWNFLLDRARGKYRAILDDDNEKLPRFIEELAGKLDADPSLDVVTCGLLVVEGDRREEFHINLGTTPHELAHRSTCDGGGMMFRRSLWDRTGYFCEDLRTNEDWEWLRRAAQRARVLNLEECLSTYRVHNAQRMTRCEELLGNSDDIQRVKWRDPDAGALGVRVVRAAPAKLTRSQDDAISSLCRALGALPWVEEGGEDLAVVLSPFQLSDEDIRYGVGSCQRAVFVCIEDPYALEANQARVRALLPHVPNLWVSTNDASCVSHYHGLVGDRIVICPLLGADPLVASPHLDAARDVDVLLCGYAYPSRKRFMDRLLPQLGGLRVLLVGDGWDGYASGGAEFAAGGVEVRPTQGLEATYAAHACARAVVCLHRTSGDCSDGPVSPETMNRGFMEGYDGARVFVDRSRPRHPHDAGDVVHYSSVDDLAVRLRRYLDGPDDPRASVYAEKCRSIYTYPVRFGRILQAVRAPRHYAEIP